MEPERPRVGLPVRPTVSAPKVSLPERPLVQGGSLTVVTVEIPVERRVQLTAWERDLLLLIASDDRGRVVDAISVQDVVRRFEDAGLIVITKRGGKPRAMVTEAGRETCRRGWFSQNVD